MALSRKGFGGRAQERAPEARRPEEEAFPADASGQDPGPPLGPAPPSEPALTPTSGPAPAPPSEKALRRVSAPPPRTSAFPEADAAPDSSSALMINVVALGLDVGPGAEGVKRPDEPRLKVLLIGPPGGGPGQWRLPGVWASPALPLESTARGLISNLIGGGGFHLEGLGAFGALERRPGRLAFGCAFMALVGAAASRAPAASAGPDEGPPAWAGVRLDLAGGRVALSGGPDRPVVVAGRAESSGRTRTVRLKAASSPLGLDHADMLLAALLLLKETRLTSDRVFELMPEAFSIGCLQSVFEAVGGDKLLGPAFRRKISPRIAPTPNFIRDKKFRPPRLFRYDPGWRS